MENEAIQVKKMRWLTPKFRIGFLIFSCLALFISITERWMGTKDKMEMVCKTSDLHPEYAKKIDIETYLMTRPQLTQLFSQPKDAPLISWEQNQTGIINDSSPLYFVLRLRNRGSSYAWGNLIAHSKRWIRGTGVEGKEIIIQYLPPQMNDFQTIVLTTAFDISGFDTLDCFSQSSSAITTEWLSLYTSKTGKQK